MVLYKARAPRCTFIEVQKLYEQVFDLEKVQKFLI